VPEYVRHVKSTLTPAERAELDEVDALAERLRSHLHSQSEIITALHVFRAQSKAIQDHVGRLLQHELRFGSEVVLTPQEGFVTRSRPDFFFRLSTDRGIIAEVERGGTTANNHDLKDLWKTHVASDAHHLFLVVPVELQNELGTVRERPFRKVVRRMGAFFGDSRREIDVVSVHIFGY
jgi:hypothetical protein